MIRIARLTAMVGFSIVSVSAVSESAIVDINLDVKHEVKGVSDFNRKKHITLHSAFTESDWNGESDTMNYLMNDLDVYFGRDNGMASWIFKATRQDPDNLGKPDIDDLANFGQWHKTNMYDSLPESLRAFESRSDEMIMGITPHGPFPTQSYWPKDLAGIDDDTGKYILREIGDGAEWVGEYLDQFFRKSGESSGVKMPKYWEVINEPDMDINVGRTFVMSSFEQVFEYHNLVAEQIRSKLPEGERPLIGGMTWGLHDLEAGDLSERYPTQEAAVRARYAYEPGDLEDFLQTITSSDYWVTQDDKYFQWDAIWKGFMDAAGENMDFYSIHLYDWSQLGDNPRQGSTFRRGMKTEAILDMVEWYDAQVNGKDNIKPWVISEYGAIASKHGTLGFLENDYRYADWLHLRTFNQMFMQLLTRPNQILKSMPFSPVKAKWGLKAGPNGEAIRYEAALMQTDEPLAENYDSADWYVTDKIQWFELWSDVKGTRVDTHSSDPDVQVDAYVDGNHVYLILNNLEWYDIPVDLSFMGENGNTVDRVKVKHSYLAEGLSPTNLGRPILAQAMLDELPDSVTLEPGSTVILDVEYSQNVQITSTSREEKFYGESLAGAGRGEAAKGKIHRVLGNSMTGRIENVSIPTHGEATLRIAAEFYPFHASKPANNTFTINGHVLDVPTQINANASGTLVEHYDYMGPEVDETSTSLNLIEIPVPLEFLQESNEVSANVASAKAFTAISLSVWDMEKEVVRSDKSLCDPCAIPSSLYITGENAVLVGETIALKANIAPSDVGNKNVYWSTSDVKIASVDQNGLVTGTGSGTATITAAAQEGVVIAQYNVSTETIRPTSVNIDLESAIMVAGDAISLDASILPVNATVQTLMWSSSNESVATVDNNGTVTAVGNGFSTVSATAIDGGATDSVTVEVRSIPLESIDLVSTAVIVLPGTYEASVTFAPTDATDVSLIWATNNYQIATVDQNGTITGVSPGVTTITATSSDGQHQDAIVVNVIDPEEITSIGSVVEAESFSDTGGPYGGFEVSENGINNNQSGDWADFDIYFPEAGVYRLILDAATPAASGTGVEVFIDGISMGSADIPSTGSWDVMQSTIVTNNLLVASEGIQRIRIQSIGAEGKWQWNADKISYILLSPLNPEVDPDLDPEPPIDPEPPTEPSLTLDDANKYLTEQYAVGGNILVTANYDAGDGHTVVGDLGGVKFFLREMTEDWSTVVNDVVAFDASAINQTSGVSTASLSLANVLPSDELPAGNFYFLYAAFKSSDGNTYKISGVSPITIVAEGTDPEEPQLPLDPVLALDDVEKYQDRVYEKGTTMSLTFVYAAGEGNTVVSSQYAGIESGVIVVLQELRADGSQVRKVATGDASVIGNQQGVVTVDLALVHPTQGELKASDELPSGHYYNLAARFKSSSGSTLIMDNVSPIIIGNIGSEVETPTEPGPEADGSVGLAVDDVSKYRDTLYQKGGDLEVTAIFDAGVQNYIVESSFGGVSGGVIFVLQELRADGSQVKRVAVADTTATGLQHGVINVTVPLVHPAHGDLKPSAELTTGHYYNLTARFKLSDGSTHFLPNIFPIQIVDDIRPSEPDFDSDGISDAEDIDDDNDGVADVDDAFPMNALESSDFDGDLIGDNADNDDDNDNVPDSIDYFQFDAAFGVLGDFDGDNDVDRKDVSHFVRKLRDPAMIRPEFDFNGDGKVHQNDVSGLRVLCTRYLCAEQ